MLKKLLPLFISTKKNCSIISSDLKLKQPHYIKFSFIKEGEGNELREVTTDNEPILIVQSGRGSQVRRAKFKVVKVTEVMGWKAVGTKLVDYTKSIEMEWEKRKDGSQPELFE